jgi:hypothetical protein
LDVNTTDTLQPGKQVYPNYAIVPQDSSRYSKITEKLARYFGPPGPTMEDRGKKGVQISVVQAIEIVRLIKTKSENTWRDRTIDAVIDKIASKFGNKITLKFRTAKRSVGEDGFMASGTLSGLEDEDAKNGQIPTLWIMDVETTEGGKKFMYPTFVIPRKLDKLLMFNRG